jgi:hypothetical protein
MVASSLDIKRANRFAEQLATDAGTPASSTASWQRSASVSGR